MLRTFPPSNAGLQSCRVEKTFSTKQCWSAWKHDAEGETELESSGALELVMQGVCSFFPLKEEKLSALGRSWDYSNCHDGDSCGWAMPTIFATALRAGGRRDRSHFLLIHLLFGLVGPDSAVFRDTSRSWSWPPAWE